MSNRYANASAAYVGHDVLRKGEEFGDDEITEDYALVIAHDGELVAVEGTADELRQILADLTDRLSELERAETPDACPKGWEGEHDWTLVEHGYERTWPSVDVDGEGRVTALAGADSFGDDGEGYFLYCQNCGGERQVQGEVDFKLS